MRVDKLIEGLQLLSLLAPTYALNGAHLLGWHAEGPFLQEAKRGAHTVTFLLPAPAAFRTFEEVYGTKNLQSGFLDANGEKTFGVKLITAAPEVEGVMATIPEVTKRGIVFSIGHSVANSDTATRAVKRGAKLITHLFNAMPQLHHRDPCIIGLLGASFLPEQNPLRNPLDMRTKEETQAAQLLRRKGTHASLVDEACSEIPTPPDTPRHEDGHDAVLQTMDEYKRPFYGIIVDGIHSHPNSVRLAYSAHPEGCILITDAMPMIDPHLKDGVYDWREGKRVIKEGAKLYIEGTDTLAGSVVSLDSCVRKFARFTASSIGKAIVCATYNPAKCLGIENKKGTLRPGSDADLVVLDKEGKVLSTWVRGREVWKGGKFLS